LEAPNFKILNNVKLNIRLRFEIADIFMAVETYKEVKLSEIYDYSPEDPTL
jgi:hypothetical protein